MKRLGNTVIEKKVRSACFEIKSSDISKSAGNTYHKKKGKGKKKKEKGKRKKKDIDDSNRNNRKRFNWQGRWKMERRRIEK